MFVDGHWVEAHGGGAVAEQLDENIYLALSLRNVGAGIGVMQGWCPKAGQPRSNVEPAPVEEFRGQTRDLYISGGDIGLWQGALRDATETVHDEIARAVSQRQPCSVELLYSDQVGGQRAISRFLLVPTGEDRWTASVSRHWYLDQQGPR